MLSVCALCFACIYACMCLHLVYTLFVLSRVEVVTGFRPVLLPLFPNRDRLLDAVAVAGSQRGAACPIGESSPYLTTSCSTNMSAPFPPSA